MTKFSTDPEIFLSLYTCINAHGQPILNFWESVSKTMIKTGGMKTEPSHTSKFTLKILPTQLLAHFTFHFAVYYLGCSIIHSSTPKIYRVHQRTWWGTLLKAFSRSPNTRYRFFSARDFYFDCLTMNMTFCRWSFGSLQFPLIKVSPFPS